MGILLLANVVVHATVFVHQRQTMKDLQERYQKTRKGLPEKETGGQESVLQAVTDMTAFKGRLPETGEFTRVVDDLFAVFERMGLPLEKMSFSPERDDSLGLVKYTTSFSVKGSYSKLRALLADIQNSQRLFCIEQLSFANQAGERGSVTLKLRIATYLKS